MVLVVGGSSARDFKTKYIATGAATVDESKTLSDMECGEGFDRATLSLLGKQEQLIEAVAKTGKPLVIVYIEGRPLLMNRASEVANALLTAWYPGEQGGKAIASGTTAIEHRADLLTGLWGGVVAKLVVRHVGVRTNHGDALH